MSGLPSSDSAIDPAHEYMDPNYMTTSDTPRCDALFGEIVAYLKARDIDYDDSGLPDDAPTWKKLARQLERELAAYKRGPSGDKLHVEPTPMGFVAYYDPEGLNGHGHNPREAVEVLLDQTDEAYRGEWDKREKMRRELAEARQVLFDIGLNYDHADFVLVTVRDRLGHDSDCAQHNAPALPIGPCNCRLSKLASTESGRATAPEPRPLFSNWQGKPCEVCKRAVYPPSTIHGRAAAVLGDRVWHGECFPPEGVSGTFTAGGVPDRDAAP